MTKRLTLFIIHSTLFIVLISCPIAPSWAAPLPHGGGVVGEAMRDVFAAMPDSIAPLVTKNNRLDCIDFIENNMEAKVRNKLDEYVTLEALTADYARFRTSSVSLMELKLLPVNDSTAVLCVVTTAQMGEEGSTVRMEDSHIRFLNPDWSPLPADTLRRGVERTYEQIATHLCAMPDASSNDLAQALRTLADFHPVKMALAADDATLTVTLQTAQLSKTEREAVRDHLQPITLMWDGERFVGP